MIDASESSGTHAFAAVPQLPHMMMMRSLFKDSLYETQKMP